MIYIDATSQVQGDIPTQIILNWKQAERNKQYRKWKKILPDIQKEMENTFLRNRYGAIKPKA